MTKKSEYAKIYTDFKKLKAKNEELKEENQVLMIWNQTLAKRLEDANQKHLDQKHVVNEVAKFKIQKLETTVRELSRMLTGGE